LFDYVRPPAPSPSIAPVHGLLETAARGKQWVVVCRRPIVPRSSHAGAKGQTTNANPCKFAEID